MVGRRIAGALLSLPAPGTGHCLIGRERRGAVLFALLLLATIAVPFLGPGALAATVLLRLGSAIDVLAIRGTATRGKRAVGGAAVLLILGIGFLAAVRLFYMEAFRVPSDGMAPTIQPGDHILGSKFSLPPPDGEVVVYRAMEEGAGNYVQRVIGRAGDAIAIRKGLLYIDGVQVTDPARSQPCELPGGDGQVTCLAEEVGDRSYTIALAGDPAAGDYPDEAGCGPGMDAVEHGCRVPDGHLFLLGDNRNGSHDSRHFGPVSTDRILATVSFVWWSSGPDGARWNRIGVEP